MSPALVWHHGTAMTKRYACNVVIDRTADA